MRLIKQAVEIGNGAAVYVPREYAGKEVEIIIPEGIDEIKKRVLNKLINFMPNVLGIYLYGSYARNEQTKESDIDILILTREKDDKIKYIFEDIDIRVLTLEETNKAIESFPAIIIPILRESISFVNPLLLEELKKRKFDLKKFIWHFDDTKRIIKIIEKFIEINEEEISNSHIYSLIMRIRVLYMIESLIKNKSFNNIDIKKILLNNGLSKRIYNKFYFIYNKIRNNEEPKDKINKNEILILIKIIKKYLGKIENETEKKIRKRNNLFRRAN
ncbi:nucleotidyltransferase domain-containing protein [Candidatus Pacearchaeota archaeon]|nr:nucleotidyltransferase domain-containing protein [Candidatus Pacearchaeota archaeon]